MPKLRSVLYMAAALAMVLCITGVSVAETTYSQDFAGGVGDFTIANTVGGATNGWAANSTCAASLLAGHSNPANLRWGTFNDCANYGLGTTSSTASTPALTLPTGCELSFNYLLQFAEGPTWDDADVEVQGGATLASYTNGTLTSGPAWKLLGGLSLPAGSVTIDFIGAVTDFTLNTGAGFHIDDVLVDCPATTTPATSGWGVFVLMLGISTAMAVGLFRLRRRSEVRGL